MLMLRADDIEAYLNSWFGRWNNLLVPLVVFAGAFVLLRRKYFWVQLLAPLLLAGIAFFLLFAVELAWVFRDGLGPDSTESHGDAAVARWADGLGLTLALGLGVSVAIVLPALLSRNRPR